MFVFAKNQLDAKVFTKIVEAFKPELCQVVCDTDSDENSSRKRLIKSHNVTDALYQQCISEQESIKVSWIFLRFHIWHNIANFRLMLGHKVNFFCYNLCFFSLFKIKIHSIWCMAVKFCTDCVEYSSNIMVEFSFLCILFKFSNK